ncbi:MAG: hypothetical protein RL385_2292 [Pseudomonadota bacterium]|jgi:hypothetical protein
MEPNPGMGRERRAGDFDIGRSGQCPDGHGPDRGANRFTVRGAAS